MDERDHLEAMSRERWEAHKGVHEQEALARGEAATRIDNRLADLNELRREVLIDRAGYVTKETFSATIEALEIRIGAEAEKAHSRINTLSDADTKRQGREQGLSLGWSILVGALGFIATVMAIYLALAP